MNSQYKVETMDPDGERRMQTVPGSHIVHRDPALGVASVPAIVASMNTPTTIPAMPSLARPQGPYRSWLTKSLNFTAALGPALVKRWIAYVDCDKDYRDKFEMLGPVSINGKVYRCTGVLISVMNHHAGQQLFKGERIGLEVEAP